MEAKKGELRDLKENFSYRLLEELAAGADLDRLLEEYLGDDHRKSLEEELTMPWTAWMRASSRKTSRTA